MAAILKQYGLDKLKKEVKEDVANALLEELEIEQVKPDEIPDWHWDIIKERIADADANPGEGISWGELKKKWAERK